MIANDITVKPGQIWADNDPRCSGRTMRVDDIKFSSRMGCDVAVCTILTNADGRQRKIDQGDPWFRDMRGTQTEVAIRRMRPTSSGYRLVAEAGPGADAVAERLG